MSLPRLSCLTLSLIAWGGRAWGQDAPCGPASARTPDLANPAVLERLTTRDTAPGGMRLAILARPMSCDTVVARVTVRFGDEVVLADRVPTVHIMRKMIGLGTSTMSGRMVRDSFARMSTTLSVSGSASRISVLLRTTRRSLAPALALTATLLRQPRFEQVAFDSVRADILAGLREDSADVAAMASARLLQAVSPYVPPHPLAPLSPEQELRAFRRVSLEDVRRVYADLVGGSVGDVAIVGPAARHEVRDLVTHVFADWRSPRPFALMLRRPYDPPGAVIALAVPSAPTVLYRARRNISVAINSQRHAALVLGQYLFGGGFSRARLTGIPAHLATERPTSDLVITLGEGDGSLTIRAAATAATFGALERAIAREIGRLRADGVTQEEVEQAKSEWLREQRTTRASDEQIAVWLSNQWLVGRTFADDAAFERQVAALTPAAVNDALNEYLNPRRMTVVEAGPIPR